MNETLGMSNLNLPKHKIVGSEGENMYVFYETKIDSNGEILLRSEVAMDGYYKEPE